MNESMGGAFGSVEQWEGVQTLVQMSCRWNKTNKQTKERARFGQISTNSNETRVFPIYLSNTWSIQWLYGCGRSLGCKVQVSNQQQMVRIWIGDERFGGTHGVLTLLKPQRCLFMSTDAVACICNVLGDSWVPVWVGKGCRRLLCGEIRWGAQKRSRHRQTMRNFDATINTITRRDEGFEGRHVVGLDKVVR